MQVYPQGNCVRCLRLSFLRIRTLDLALQKNRQYLHLTLEGLLRLPSGTCQTKFIVPALDRVIPDTDVEWVIPYLEVSLSVCSKSFVHYLEILNCKLQK